MVGSRNPGDVQARLAESLWRCERRQVRLESLGEPEQWEQALQGIDAVLNCVGILRQRGAQTYARIHHQAPAALAVQCSKLGLRLVQVSALGLQAPVRSRFLTSKLAGERAIQAASGDWVIARPSLLDGEGGFGATWLRGVARLPLFVAPADAKGLIAALDVAELGEALTTLTLDSPERLQLSVSREFELGGPVAQNFRDYIRSLRQQHTDRPALCIPIPGLLARLGSHICDLLHVTPFSYGHWELLRNNNLPQPNRMAELLGRPPRAIGGPQTDG